MENTLGRRIEELRRQKGWSKSELARRSSVTTTAVWNWEVNGRKPRPETMSGIAQALGVSEFFLEHGFEASSAQVPVAADHPTSVNSGALTVADIVKSARAQIATVSGMPEEQVRITVEFTPG